jgi:hypothetical protein
MSRVFLSYRRSDSQDVAGRIFDRLSAYLTRNGVFKDIDDIPAGVNFEDHVQQALSDCSAVLVLIGPTYLTCTDSRGRRRLFDDPEDLVRREVEAALALKIPTIPVPVSNAAMPREDQLPETLRPLAKMNGLPVRPDPDFNRDIDRLLGQLAPLLGGYIRAELEQRRQEATRLRERLSSLAWQFEQLKDLMNQGYPLIEGAAYIAQELGRQLGTAMSPRVLGERLAADSQLRLSTAIVGWWRARLPARLDQLRGELQAASAELPGHLEIFRHLLKLLETIWHNSYSPDFFFKRLLTVPGDKLLPDVPPDLAPTETVQALTSSLQSNAALYYASRYEEAMELMNEFVREAVHAYKELSADDLITLTLGSADQESMDSTQMMRTLLNLAQTKLSPGAFVNLHRLIDTIERAVSDEAALGRLAAREPRSTKRATAKSNRKR